MFGQELRKFFNYKRLIILVFFGGIYFLLFLKPYVKSENRDISYMVGVQFGIELIQRYGMEIDAEEFENMKINLPYPENAVDDFMRHNKTIQSYNIENFWYFLNNERYLDEDVCKTVSSLIGENIDEEDILDAHMKLMSYGFQIDMMTAYEQEALGKNGTRVYVDLNRSQQKRVEQRNQKEVFGILPFVVADNLMEVLQFACTFMLLSVSFLIVPYCMKDKLSGMTIMQYTSRPGRAYFLIRLSAAVSGILLVLIILTGILAVIFYQNQIFFFWDCPLSSFASGFISWYPWTVGTLILAAVGLTILLALGLSMLVFCVTGICGSYITAIGCQLPVLIAAGIFGGVLMSRFTELVQNPIMVPLVSMGGLAVGLVLGIITYMRERQKDIVEIK